MSCAYIKGKNYIKCGVSAHMKEELFSENEINQSSSKSKWKEMSFLQVWVWISHYRTNIEILYKISLNDHGGFLSKYISRDYYPHSNVQKRNDRVTNGLNVPY